MADTTDRREMLREAMQEAAQEEETPEVEAEETQGPGQLEVEESAEPSEEPKTEGKDASDRDEKAEAPAKQEAKPRASAAKVEAFPPPAAAQQPKGPEIRPPQSLKPAAREVWNKLAANPDARALLEDVARVEGETRRVLGENAQLRKSTGEAMQFRQGVDQLVGPVTGFFASEGLGAYQGLSNLVGVYAALHGPPQQRNRILASLIQQYGNDVEGINAVLTGQAPQPGPQPQQQYRQAQPQVDPREIVRQELAAARQQAETQQADSELDTFLHSSSGAEPEFIRDVWQDMMLLLDAAHSQGRKLTYQQAYDRSLKMNEDVQAVLAQRAAAAAVAAPPSASPAQRARAAAATSKPRSAPSVGGPGLDPGDRRAMLEKMARGR